MLYFHAVYIPGLVLPSGQKPTFGQKFPEKEV
jgi:hypothetical protein